MRRYGGLIVSGVGLLILALSAVKVLPFWTGAGVTVIILGLVLFGLSFVPRPEGLSDGEPMNDFQRLIGVFFAPTETFRNLRRHPRWLAPLILMSLLSGAYLMTFTQRLTPERIANVETDKIAESGFVPPEKVSELRENNLKLKKDVFAQTSNVVVGFVGSFLAFALLSVIYLVIVLAMGGKINFWQSLSATVFAAVPSAIITRLLSSILLFLKDPIDIHPILGQGSLVADNLGAFLNSADNPVLWVLASSIGALSLYHLWLTATGLKNAGERVPSSAAWTAALVIWVFGIAFGVLMAAAFPSFLS